MAQIDDYRVRRGTCDHEKIEDLVAYAGEAAYRCLHRLWDWAAGKPALREDGVLRGLDPGAVERRARWMGTPGAFFTACLRVGLIDTTPDGPAIHDWADHQPHIIQAAETSSRQKRNANSRWSGRSAGVAPAGEEKIETAAPNVGRKHVAHMPSLMPLCESGIRSTECGNATGNATGNAPLLSPAVFSQNPKTAALAAGLSKENPIEKIPPLTAVPAFPAPISDAEVRNAVDALSQEPPFALTAEKAGLLKQNDVAKALRERWPAAPPTTESARIVEKILIEQRVERGEVLRTLEFCAHQLTGDPYDVQTRRFVANALYAIRKPRAHAVHSLAIYMRGKVSKEKPLGEGMKFMPSEMHLNEAKGLIERWMSELQKQRASAAPSRTMREIMMAIGG